VDEIEEFLTGSRHAAVTDRVLATVLFTDIVGSTERAAQLGDQSVARAPRRPRRRGAPPAGAVPGPRGQHPW
jgi:class 3 adenylate cyclase